MNQFWLFLKHIGVIDFYWVHNYTKKTIIFTFAHLNCGSQWEQIRLCKLSFIFFLKIWLDGWNISFDKQSKVFILFCYFFVILLTGSNHRFSEKIQTLEMYYHHFTWLLYLVICHFGKNCSKRLKISEMTIYSSYLYFWIFI